MNFIGNFFLFPVVKKIENRLLTFDEVTTMSIVPPLLEHGVIGEEEKCPQF